MLERIKKNWIYLLFGLGLFLKGLYFFEQRQFFFYPPEWQWIMNNVLFDGLMMLLGIALAIYIVLPVYNKRILAGLLAAIMVVFAIVVMIEMEHVVFAGQLKLKENIASNLMIIGFILYAAQNIPKR